MRHDIPGMNAGLAKQGEMQIGGSTYQPTLRERLIGQKAELTQRLANVDAAIAALDKMPDFEEVMNIIGKVY